MSTSTNNDPRDDAPIPLADDPPAPMTEPIDDVPQQQTNEPRLKQALPGQLHDHDPADIQPLPLSTINRDVEPALSPAAIARLQAAPASSTEIPTRKTAVHRLISIDAYRGLVMLLMIKEVVPLAALADKYKGNRFWDLVSFHARHVQWFGCSLHDLIQPSFTFLVGAALPFSIASRQAKGQSFTRMLFHAAWRALLLVALGIFLRSQNSSQTNFTFEDTLTQIGLGYIFAFLLGFCRVRTQLIALAVILIGYWAAFVAYPAPAKDFDYKAVGVPADWKYHREGLGAHFNKNSNLAAAFDRWFLNQFPRPKPFTHNGGGYATLSFIPTLGTMILGLLAGGALRASLRPWTRIGLFVTAGIASLAAALALDYFNICPSIKVIWTPAWVLFSGGWCFLLLAAFYTFTDAVGWRAWILPLAVIGMNSIAMYVLAHGFDNYIVRSIRIHLGKAVFQRFNWTWQPMFEGIAVVAILWLIAAWMYRRKLFLRI